MPMKYAHHNQRSSIVPLLGAMTNVSKGWEVEDALAQKAKEAEDIKAHRAGQLSLQKEQLALQKANAARAAGAAALARKDRKALLAAEVSGNDAFMQSLLPTKGTEDYISTGDAEKAMLASPKILQRAADANENGHTMQPFMRENTPEPLPLDPNVIQLDEGTVMPTDGGGTAIPAPEMFGNNPLLADAPVINVGDLMKAPEVIPPTPMVSSMADENYAVNSGAKEILRAGAENPWNKEAGVPLSQREVMKAATTDTMVTSLMGSYANAKTPRAKNAIAKKIVALQNVQAATAAKNADRTHDLNKIKVKGLLDPETRPDVTTTVKADPKLLADTKKELGVQTQDWSGKVTNAGSDYGTFTKNNVNNYEVFARKAAAKQGKSLTDAQLAAALPYLKNTNSILDDTMTMSPEEFYKFAISLPTTSTKTKN